MPGQLSRAEKEARARALIEAGKQTAALWAQSQLGRVRPVLIEEYRDGVPQGYTPEYALVRVPGARPGQIVPARLTRFDEEGVFDGENAAAPGA